MVSELSKLSISEKELVLKAPLLVCMLVAGADGRIDDKELAEAINMARDRQWVKPNLTNYYSEVCQDFEDKIKILIQAYPFESGERNEKITSELGELNGLWGKLGPDFSTALLDSLKYTAQRIASASGGFWRRISSQEAELLHLPMLSLPENK